MTEYVTADIETGVGVLRITGSERGVRSVSFADRFQQQKKSLPPPVLQCIRELREYCGGDRTHFTVPLVLLSTDFQLEVWDALLKVPFGTTVTYGALAERSGHSGAARAVGNAVHDNPVAIIVPCHRVLPAAGGIGQYASGPQKKEWLLRLEGAMRDA